MRIGLGKLLHLSISVLNFSNCQLNQIIIHHSRYIRALVKEHRVNSTSGIVQSFCGAIRSIAITVCQCLRNVASQTICPFFIFISCISTMSDVGEKCRTQLSTCEEMSLPIFLVGGLFNFFPFVESNKVD